MSQGVEEPSTGSLDVGDGVSPTEARNAASFFRGLPGLQRRAAGPRAHGLVSPERANRGRRVAAELVEPMGGDGHAEVPA